MTVETAKCKVAVFFLGNSMLRWSPKLLDVGHTCECEPLALIYNLT